MMVSLFIEDLNCFRFVFFPWSIQLKENYSIIVCQNRLQTECFVYGIDISGIKRTPFLSPTQNACARLHTLHAFTSWTSCHVSRTKWRISSTAGDLTFKKIKNQSAQRFHQRYKSLKAFRISTTSTKTKSRRKWDFYLKYEASYDLNVAYPQGRNFSFNFTAELY